MRRLVLVLALIALTGCSHDFWYRTPQVAGRVQTACPPNDCPPVASCPAPETYAAPCPPACPAPAPYTAPCPQACPPPGPVGVPRSTPPVVSSVLPAQASAGGQPTCEEQAVLDEVNRIRSSMGLRPFLFNPVLHLAAEAHSREQCAYGYMGHGSPDPRRKTLVQRMEQAGYDGLVFGEVVAWGYQTPSAVVEGWMNSRDHRAILTDRDMQEAAFSRIGDYWTGNFGTPSARARPRTLPAPGSSYAPTYAPAPPRQEPVRVPPQAPPAATLATPRAAPRAPSYVAPSPTPSPPPGWRPPARGG